MKRLSAGYSISCNRAPIPSCCAPKCSYDTKYIPTNAGVCSILEVSILLMKMCMRSLELHYRPWDRLHQGQSRELEAAQTPEGCRSNIPSINCQRLVCEKEMNIYPVVFVCLFVLFGGAGEFCHWIYILTNTVIKHFK